MPYKDLEKKREYDRKRAREKRQADPEKNREYCKNYYSKNKEKLKKQIDEARKTRISKGKEIIRGLKNAPCLDCGNFFHPEVMDFDHVRGIKLHNVSWMVGQGMALSRILEEIEKCDLVCSNCHRLRTWSRRQVRILPPELLRNRLMARH